MAHRDNLDGTKQQNILFRLYLFPGKMILWLKYMSPEKGKAIVSGRRARSPIFTFITATAFWGVVIFLVVDSL